MQFKYWWVLALLAIVLLGLSQISFYQFFPTRGTPGVPSGYRLNRLTGNLTVVRGTKAQRVQEVEKGIKFTPGKGRVGSWEGGPKEWMILDRLMKSLEQNKGKGEPFGGKSPFFRKGGKPPGGASGEKPAP